HFIILSEDCTIFGVPLSIAVERNPSHDGIRLPAIVRECIDFIEEKGLLCEGIYRLGGMKGKVQSLRRAYNAGEIVHLGDQQPHVVASLLKHYLRELPETILTVDMMPHFEDVSLIPNPRERAEALRQLIDRLPTTNRILLQYVLKHMGHVIEKEKDTKMSYHNVCVVLSPTMQISHRVLNVMFHSHQYLFGNVVIKKYYPPITSYSGAKRSIDDLKSLTEIEEEIQKQESLLASLHSAIAAGRISQKKEEQLWEAQRIVTLLKRKLKSVQKKEMGNIQKNSSDNAPDIELSSEESQKDTVIIPPKLPEGQRSAKIIVSEKGEDKKRSLSETKSGSETDTTGTPSFKTPSNEPFSRISSEGDSDRNQISSVPLKREELNKVEIPKEQIIPILPKPLSARAERNKLAQANREKMGVAATVSFPGRKREEIPQTQERTSSFEINQKDCRNTFHVNSQQTADISNKIMGVDSRKISLDKDAQRGKKLLDISGNVVPHLNLVKNMPLPLRERKLIKPSYYSSRKSRVHMYMVILSTCMSVYLWNGYVIFVNVRLHHICYMDCLFIKLVLFLLAHIDCSYTKPFRPSHSLSEDSDYSFLLNEEARLHMEHEELLAMNHELTRKLQSEKTEISRLRDEIQEMQTLYGYRTHSYDSSESEGSESDGESDNEDEILKQVLLIDKTNKLMKNENVNLTKRIQDERELIVQLRVALRQAHLANKMPQGMLSSC
ncbi:RalA-binding protein 1, partial [Armadillidium nasatum]